MIIKVKFIQGLRKGCTQIMARNLYRMMDQEDESNRNILGMPVRETQKEMT